MSIYLDSLSESRALKSTDVKHYIHTTYLFNVTSPVLPVHFLNANMSFTFLLYAENYGLGIAYLLQNCLVASACKEYSPRLNNGERHAAPNV